MNGATIRDQIVLTFRDEYVQKGYQEAYRVLRDITKPRPTIDREGKTFRTGLVGFQSCVGEPIDGSLNDLHVLVDGATADTNTTNKVVVLVERQTATKDNKTTVGLFDT